MANARMCDRCGLCFNPLGQGDMVMARFQNPIFQTSENLKNCTVDYRLLNTSSPDAWVDLCPKCSAAFKLFMAGFDTINLADCGPFDEEVDQ